MVKEDKSVRKSWSEWQDFNLRSVPNAVLYRLSPLRLRAAYSLGFRSPQGADLRKLIPVNLPENPVLPAMRLRWPLPRVCWPKAGWSRSRPRPFTASRGCHQCGRDRQLYLAKGRPAFNPLIAHVGDIRRPGDRPL